jgi:hypothetical protein
MAGPDHLDPPAQREVRVKLLSLNLSELTIELISLS